MSPILGWGHNPNQQRPDILKYATGKMMEFDKCFERYPMNVAYRIGMAR